MAVIEFVDRDVEAKKVDKKKKDTTKNIKEEKLFQDSKFIDWYKRWKIRLAQNNKPYELSLNLMNLNKII